MLKTGNPEQTDLEQKHAKQTKKQILNPKTGMCHAKPQSRKARKEKTKYGFNRRQLREQRTKMTTNRGIFTEANEGNEANTREWEFASDDGGSLVIEGASSP
jgi:hypothetical protein